MTVTDHDRLQFFSACRCYRQRDEETPSSSADAKITWGQWFEKHWGETFDAYFERLKADKLVERMVEFEEAKYGESLVKQRAQELRELVRADRAKQLRKKPKRGG